MIPSPAIEKLLSTLRPGGGPLFVQEEAQILVPVFPPNMSAKFESRPIGGDFAQIIFAVMFGSNMVPDAFEGYVELWGTRQYSGVFTASVLALEFQGFAWVTQANPALIYITNVTGLNQIFELIWTSVRITTEDDYNVVIDILNHMATSTKSEQLAVEANQLLTTIAGGPAAPKPPIGGR